MCFVAGSDSSHLSGLSVVVGLLMLTLFVVAVSLHFFIGHLCYCFVEGMWKPVSFVLCEPHCGS